MEEGSKSCFTKFSKRELLVIFAMSLFLFGLMFVRIEVVHRETEMMEAKLEKRIQRIEDEMQMKVQTIVKEMLLTEGKTMKGHSRVYANMGKSRTTVFEYMGRSTRTQEQLRSGLTAWHFIMISTNFKCLPKNNSPKDRLNHLLSIMGNCLLLPSREKSHILLNLVND